MKVRLCPFSRQPLLSLRWSSPAADLWVAANEGDFAGMVEFTGGRFVASDDHGLVMDSFASIPDATRAVDDSIRARVSAPALLSFLAARGARLAAAPSLAIAPANTLWRK
jgi:hypothetical protein